MKAGITFGKRTAISFSERAVESITDIEVGIGVLAAIPED